MPFRRRGQAGALRNFAASAFVAVMAFVLAFVVPTPYVLEVPGPTVDTFGQTEAGELITIDGAETYPTDGSLRLLTVSNRGNPQTPNNAFETFLGFSRASDALIPMESVYPEGVTVEQSNEAGRIQMLDSQDTAIAAALINLGYDLPVTVTVMQVVDGSPAAGLLAEGDQIQRVNGRSVIDVFAIREAIQAEASDPVFDVLRGGERVSVTVPTVEQHGIRFVGIVPKSDFETPFTVRIELPRIGGPSAGTVFALGIIDELTEGSLTGGVNWAGTGTIAAAGRVGPIGGVVQKMHGAVRDGATWMFVPSDNCGEVVGHIPDGLHVVAVETLSDARNALETVASTDGVATGEAAELPGCAR